MANTKTVHGRCIFAAAICGAAMVSHIASGDVVHVNQAATGAATGQSWTDAFTNLAAASAAAQPGDELWIAAGTYHPASPGGDRSASFVLKAGVPMYGGFAGVETLREQRNAAANPTVLSGDLNGDDAAGFLNTAENSYRVLVAIGVGEALLIDGLVIRAGRADGASEQDPSQAKDRGAAVMIHSGSLHAIDCLFERNWSSGFGAVADCGTGSLFQGCVFADNYSEVGAAALLIDTGAATQLESCRCERNDTPGEGAGVLVRSSTGVRFDGCRFDFNTAHRGGGLAFVAGSNGVVSGCDFEHNEAFEGAGVSIHECGPRVEFSSFHFNDAELSGAGLFAEQGWPVIEGCTFGQNAAAEGLVDGAGGQGGSGGGGTWFRGGAGLVIDTCYNTNRASFGGGLYIIEQNTAGVHGCMFIDNRANEGAAFYNLDCTPHLTGGLFTGNHAFGGSFAVGGAISNYFAPGTEIADSYFANNRAELGGGAIYNEGVDPLVKNCVFHHNEAYAEYAGWGGGILNGFFGVGTTVNCEFVGNRARLGGAMMETHGSEARTINCSMVGNIATVAGGAIYGYIGHTASYTNCLIAANTAPQITGEVLPTLSWSLVTDGFAGVGVFDGPPGVVRLASPGFDGNWGTSDDDFGDLRPIANSLLIDAGDPAAAPVDLEFDLAHESRVHDDAGAPYSGPPESAGQSAIDIGAYEFQGTSCLADFDGVNGREVADIFAFLTSWFAGAMDADVTRSRSLGVEDIFAFLAAWFNGCP